MMIGTAQSQRFGEAWAAITALVAAEGSGRDPFAATLARGSLPPRDLGDAVHGLCMLHGRHPGLIAVAAQRSPSTAGAELLAQAGEAFAAERAGLVRLVAAVGPLPSTPGQAESEAAIASQRHALDMLVSSERKGCPVGAALALLLDWPTVRRVLDVAYARYDIDPPAYAPPSGRRGAELIAALADTVAFERAMLFGAQQLLAQHRALWQLLESRAAARNAG